MTLPIFYLFMKRFISKFYKISLTSLFFVSNFLFAQQKTILEEGFLNNKKEWYVGEDDEISASVQSGEYQIKHNGEGFSCFMKDFSKLNDQSDYEVVIKIKELTGDENQAYGLVLGQKNLDNFYAFTITNKGIAGIYEFRKGELNMIASWKNSNVEIHQKNWNTLSLIKKMGEWYFSVNEKLVHRVPARNFYGDGIGFVLNNKLELSVDSVFVSSQAFTRAKVDFSLMDTEKQLFKESFDNNQNNWQITTTKTISSGISKGKLWLNNKTKKIQRFDYDLKDYADDFAIQIKMGQYSGSNTAGYGFMLGDPAEGGAYGVLLAPSRNFYAFGVVGEQVFEISPWKHNKYIKAMPEQNEITFIQQNDKWFFYVNTKLVLTTYRRKLGSKSFSFVLNSNMRVGVESLNLYSDNREIHLAVDSLTTQKQILGSTINTKYNDLGPIIQVDGKTLYFFRDGHPDNKGTKHQQDAWISNRKDLDSGWKDAINLGSPINNESSNFIISVSPDRTTMMVVNVYDNYGKCVKDGVSITHYVDGKWTMPKEIKIEGWYNYNYFNGFQLSADNKTLLISAERADAIGGTDLYVSFRKNDTLFGTPFNLGETINTTTNEITPFLAPDNQTLYFASNGHPGYGDQDIFVSKRLGAWDEWTMPYNLGSRINSSVWDAYFSISASGDDAYFVSYQGNRQAEIYTIKLKEEKLKPEAVLLVKGKVLNRKTKQAIGTKITIRNIDTGEDVALAHSNSESGEYMIVLPAKSNYAFYADYQGFYAVRENIYLDSLKDYDEIEQNLLLVPYEKGEKIPLNNIFFVKAKSQILSTSYAELNHLVKILKLNPSMKIEVGGHTDNVGDALLNMKLSEQRAEAIKKYLVKRGIDAKRLKTKGYGGTSPVGDNRFVNSRQLNRRVEFKILND